MCTKLLNCKCKVWPIGTSKIPPLAVSDVAFCVIGNLKMLLELLLIS